MITDNLSSSSGDDDALEIYEEAVTTIEAINEECRLELHHHFKRCIGDIDKAIEYVNSIKEEGRLYDGLTPFFFESVNNININLEIVQNSIESLEDDVYGVMSELERNLESYFGRMFQRLDNLRIYMNECMKFMLS